MSIDPSTRIPEARRIAALWAGLLLAPLAFLLSLEVSYAAVTRACFDTGRGLIHLVQLGCLALAVVGGLVAWRTWRAEGSAWPGQEGGAPGRTRFMAGLGLLTSALFVLVILAQGIPGFVLSPCQ
jgi:hypothetical protein